MPYFALLSHLWPHCLAMMLITLLVWRGGGPVGWQMLGVVIAVLALALSGLYRLPAFGVAPPPSERIGFAGWLAVFLTASVPLVAVGITAWMARGSSLTLVPRTLLVVGVGFVSLALYQIVGLLIYGALTNIYP